MVTNLAHSLASLGLSATNPGAWSGATVIPCAQSDQLISIDPATEHPIATVLLADKNAYETIITQAQVAAQQWRQVPAPKRGELVRLIGQRLREKKELIAELITVEMGKSLQEAQGEVQEMIDMADFAVGQSRMLYGLTMHSERAAHRMYEQWHPYGVVGVLTSFNFPVAVWAWNAFIAVICGNVVLWKPSSKTPLCAIAVQIICNEVMIAQGFQAIFSLWIPASHAIAEIMLDDPRLPLISFTGSTKVGRSLAERVAKRLGKCLLELGGNNAVIVDESADLNLALSAVVFGAIGTAGQRCTTTRRLFLHASIYEVMLARLLKAYRSLRMGSPLDLNHHMGPLVDSAAVSNFEQAIARIVSLGGVLAHGGKRLQGPGFFVEPTLVTNVQPEWDIVQTETFAPILYVMPYQDIEQAIALQNAVPQGLSSSLFTQQLRTAELYLSAMGSDCGIANINVGTSGAEIGGAFGGEKETGGGREAGSDAWKAYMRRQTNTINWGTALPLAQGIQFDI
ncbi:MAG: aldehyde dehydrogenase family protein [Gammaproteobacteria bacterium]|nr:aldehyde dehydrogenase family protein [Gammaproteobacteria bacterium]